MNEQSFRSALEMFRRMSGDPDRPAKFTALNREWDLIPGVFAPIYTPVTELFSTWIPYPVDGTFLEMGPGAGVTAVVAALSGCRAVTALDISVAAVENTRRNAERHGVSGRVRVLHSDLFAAVDSGERFDMIFWNSDFIEAPADFVNETEFHYSFFDPQYETHRKFLGQAPKYLTDRGRLLLGFNNLGNKSLLRTLCSEVGLEISIMESAKRTVKTTIERTIEFQLLNLSPARNRS